MVGEAWPRPELPPTVASAAQSLRTDPQREPGTPTGGRGGGATGGLNRVAFWREEASSATLRSESAVTPCPGPRPGRGRALTCQGIPCKRPPTPAPDGHRPDPAPLRPALGRGSLPTFSRHN